MRGHPRNGDRVPCELLRSSCSRGSSGTLGAHMARKSVWFLLVVHGRREKRNVLAVNGNATCVSEVVGEDVEEEGIYDLAGRKLKQISSPGVYIVNGKKTLVK